MNFAIRNTLILSRLRCRRKRCKKMPSRKRNQPPATSKERRGRKMICDVFPSGVQTRKTKCRGRKKKKVRREGEMEASRRRLCRVAREARQPRSAGGDGYLSKHQTGGCCWRDIRKYSGALGEVEFTATESLFPLSPRRRATAPCSRRVP